MRFWKRMTVIGYIGIVWGAALLLLCFYALLFLCLFLLANSIEQASLGMTLIVLLILTYSKIVLPTFRSEWEIVRDKWLNA